MSSVIASVNAWVAKLVALTLLASGLAACATSSSPSGKRAPDTEQTMNTLRAQNAGYVRQIEELQNRIFILEDRLDSLRMAGEQKSAPLLPVKRPEPAASAALPEPPPAEDQAATIDSEIEYAGDAALDAGGALPGDRPLLRLSAETSEIREPIPAEPLRLYRASLALLTAGRHVQALAGFQKFLARFPSHDYADNAQYWRGECYYDRKQYRAAAREFRRVVEQFPQGNKVPDAMLKLGFSQLAVGEGDGRQVLEAVVKAFPQHRTAALARTRLQKTHDPGKDGVIGTAVAPAAKAAR
jgi:tol-pal system protein YbgF